MSPALEEAILAVSASFALSTLAKATIALALGLAAAALARRKRAAFRHTLVAAVFGALVALPLVSAIATPVGVALRPIRSRSLPGLVPRPFPAPGPVVIRVPGAVPLQSPGWSFGDLLMAAWGAGAALFLLPVAAGLWQVRRLRRSALPWRREHGIDLLLHERLGGPITCGALRPAILLPADAPDWPAADLARAIAHELEHVARRDWLVHCLARGVCAVYWFHPLAWIAWRRLEIEAERACDDAVLAGSEATAYADQLVAVARRLSAAPKAPLLAMASRADLASRVRAVLDARQRRGRAGKACVILASIAGAAFVLALAPLRLVAAPQAAGPLPTRAHIRAETALVMTGVKVSYPSGAPVEGLAAADFAITEDGVPETVAVFEAFKEGYMLGYYPRNGRADGAFRKIHIVVKTATTANLEYRDGYYAPQRRDVPAPAPPAGSAAVPDVRPPQLIFKKDAEYADYARKVKHQGTVMLDVDVDTGGNVTGVRLIRSLGLGLDEKAIQAVRQWRFKPATKNGAPVSVELQVEVSFRLL